MELTEITFPPPTHEPIENALELMRGIRQQPEQQRLLDTPNGFKPFVSVGEAISDLPSLQAGEGEEVSDYTSDPQTKYHRERRRRAKKLHNHHSWRHSPDLLKKMSWIPEGGRVHELPPELNFSPNSFSQAYARLHRNGIAYTITTFVHNAGSGRFWHYRDQRTITVREAARLQSFDDNFVFVGTRSDQERHAGNAVPPLLAEALADHIYTAFFIPSLAPIRRASS